MSPRILIFIFALLFSCNSKETRKQAEDSVHIRDSNTKQASIPYKKIEDETIIPTDTASSDYLSYLMKNEMPLNAYWTKKLDSLDIFALPLDSMSHISLIRDWIINDSISTIILSYSTGTSYDEFILTIKNRENFIGKVHISDQYDSDLSFGNPYYYSEYKLLDDRKIKLFKHKVTGNEGDNEKDLLLSTETLVIQSDGKVLKK